MREAARFYSKKPKQKMMPSFNSVSIRQSFFFDKRKSQQLVPGPGQYDVTLPLVKPKFQTIIKPNRSIIIKINDVISPAFDSREPRFKQTNTISHQSPRKFDDNVEKRDNVFEKQKNSHRYNFTLAKKKSSLSTSSKMLQASLQQQQSVYKNLKAPYWSKYKEQRKKWEASQNVPGPGSYNYSEREHKSPVKNNSWEFRSQTKRAFFYKNNPRNLRILEDQELKSHSIHSRQLLDKNNLNFSSRDK